MFVQLITGRTSDPEGLIRQLTRWDEEIKPGAIGFLGSTGGVTADGEMIGVVRFASAEAAQQNGARAEQTAWWNETEKFFDGQPTFRNTTDVTGLLAGGS